MKDRHPLIVTLLLSIALPISLKATAEGRPASVPRMAHICGMVVGVSRRATAERSLGRGRIAVGGHPGGGRLWRVAKPSCYLYVDGFDLPVLDTVVLSASCPVPRDPVSGTAWRSGDLPCSRIRGSSVSWVGGVRLGMTKKEVMRRVRRALGHGGRPVNPDLRSSWKVQADYVFELDGRGFVRLRKGVSYRKWGATLGFWRNRLTLIAICCEASWK